ncbi:hypothetical protein NPIL_446681 [Nephila pilipes]|uniref:Uncharacterized protein n=1 Tax=Nephila pilipes TaxID=299642 RepID=A0A8X6PIW3_NEPPI|nr:hypothetical protein NPIL_446681 [Nephila pilipes]
MNPPTSRFIPQWDKILKTTRSVVSKTGEHPKMLVTDDSEDRWHESMSRNLHKSGRQTSNELIPRSTLQDMFTNVAVLKLFSTLSHMVLA